MASTELTEYELKRLENISQKDEMMASLNIHSITTELTAITKRQRNVTKSDKVPKKKPKNDIPVVKRQSLRTRGISADSKGVSKRLKMKQAYCGERSDRSLIETIVGVGKKSQLEFGGETICKDDNLGVIKQDNETGVFFSLGSMILRPENIAQVFPNIALRFFPCNSSRMLVAGNMYGSVGFWNIDHEIKQAEEDGIYRYRPHRGSIRGISIHPHCLSKVFTSGVDGLIQMMDAEKQVFELIYSSNCGMFYLAQRSNDVKCLYFGEEYGGLNIWDARTGNCAIQWSLNDDRINTRDFNSENPNIMATSSSNGTACIWDLRSINADKPKTLKTVSHERAISSAYFSPSGRFLSATGYDDTIGITGGANFEETSMISLNSRKHRFPYLFPMPTLGVWGWDDSRFFVCSMKRGVDVICPAQSNTIFTLESPHIQAVPLSFDAHPQNVGMLAGATAGGQIYVWTLS